ncbi:hypothetical protein C7T87_11780 [Xanthomonas hortorum pv. hederae]|nr:hypothetical protein C7T87_11780 [Xanthomonas hortorum pv. hederae]
MAGGGVCRGRMRCVRSTRTPTPAPRQQRRRSKARPPVARKRCLIAPRGEGLTSILLMQNIWSP